MGQPVMLFDLHKGDDAGNCNDKNQHQKTEMQGQTAQQGNHADCRRTEEDHK